MNISIHGITPEDVASAPTMRDVFPALFEGLAEPVVVHHTHFDRVAICRAATKYGYAAPGCTWLDSARVARRAWTQFAHCGYGLANLAAEFGIGFKHHHAAEDAYTAGLILLRAVAQTGLSVSDWVARVKQPLFLSEARAEGSRPKRVGNPDDPLAGDVIAFTGALEMPRHEAADLAAAARCDVAGGVTRETTILVVGDQDIRRLHGKQKSSKHLKAEQLARDGYPLRIVGESDFKVLVAA